MLEVATKETLVGAAIKGYDEAAWAELEDSRRMPVDVSPSVVLYRSDILPLRRIAEPSVTRARMASKGHPARSGAGSRSIDAGGGAGEVEDALNLTLLELVAEALRSSRAAQPGRGDAD